MPIVVTDWFHQCPVRPLVTGGWGKFEKRTKKVNIFMKHYYPLVT